MLRHIDTFRLPLPLLVARIVADDVHHTSAAHNFAVVAQSFDASADFHNTAVGLAFWGGRKAHQYMLWHGICSRPGNHEFIVIS